MSLKILFLSHKFYPDIGGIETISEYLAHTFTKAGHEVHVLTWSMDQTNKDFPFLIIRNPSFLTLIKEHSWANLIFENNPCIRLAWPKLFFNRPSVISLHTWISRIDGRVAWQDQLKFKWLKQAHKVIACSSAIRDRCWPEATVVGNPYQEDNFKILPDIPRKDDFVFLGRLVSDKGVDLAIKAFSQLFTDKLNDFNKKAIQPSLTIIGDGPEREVLQNLVSEFGLEKNVTFTGALSGNTLVKYLNRHKFMLVPSVWEEPFGVVVLEGMACGCIPIVADGGGLPDAVGNAGLKFRRGSVDALFDCMKKLMTDTILQQHLHEQAVAHLDNFHSKKIADKYLEIVEAVQRK